LLIQPHGNKEISEIEKNLNIDYDLEVIVNSSVKYDVEMIANGAMSPLKGFMLKNDIESVISNMELESGLVWSIPIGLQIDIDKNLLGKVILLKSESNKKIAIMKVEDIFDIDLIKYVESVYGTNSSKHPGVNNILKGGKRFVGGEILTTFQELEIKGIKNEDILTPLETRKIFDDLNWSSIVAFQTRNPIHRAHEYILKVAQETVDGLLIHPLVGETKSDDITAEVRNKCYKELISNYFNSDRTILSYMPANMRYAGPREAILHMIVRKNYGCSHMIIGRDHAGVGDYYGTYEAQELVKEYSERLGIESVNFEHSFYCKKCEGMGSQKTCPHESTEHVHLSGTKVREMLSKGERPPMEFSRPEIADILIGSMKND